MIRKSGILIFVVFTALLFAVVYLFAGFAIRVTLDTTLEKIFAAEVNIEDVSVSLTPLALDITGLQITNKSQPQNNLISLKKAHADLEVWPALLGYYVINELSVTGLAYNQKRERPGKVFTSEERKEQRRNALEKLSKILKLDIPNADELLDRIDLKTLEVGKSLERQAKTQKDQLEKLPSELPEKARLLELKAQIESVTNSDIKSPSDLSKKADELKELKDNLQREQEKIEKVKSQLADSRDQLQDTVSALKNANNQDWNRLQSLANIKDGGLAPLSQILLGDFWGKRIGQIESFYRFASPYLPESENEDSEEPSVTLNNRILPLPNKPYPDFWVKKAAIDWQIAGGTAEINLQDITSEHEITGKPTAFTLKADKLPKLQSVNINGDFSIREQLIANTQWTLNAYDLSDFNFGEDEFIRFSGGSLNSEGTIKLVDNAIDQSATVTIQNANFSGVDNNYIQKIVQALNKQKEIPLTLSANGVVSSPEISVRSPLDQLIGDAVIGEAKDKISALETELRQKLDSELDKQLKAQSDWLALLDSQDQQVEQLEEIIEEALRAELNDIKSETKKKLKDKLLKLGD